MKNLKRIIQKANPEKKWNYTQIYPTHEVHACNICKTGIGELKKEVSITLPDVLLAIRKKDTTYQGLFNLTNGICYEHVGSSLGEKLFYWDLKKDLDNQSKLTIEFIKKLLI